MRPSILNISLLCIAAGAAVPTSAQGPKVLDELEKVVRICVDEAEVAPLSYEENGVLQGVNPDLARIPLEALGYRVEFRRLPWRRCVDHEMKHGYSDAALSAAWRQEREAIMWFPDNAATDGPRCRSPFALICNGPVLAVNADSAYRFSGDRSNVPQPVRITLGYVQVAEYRQRGLKVDEGPSDQVNLAKLLRDRTGSALIWLAVARLLEGDPAYKNKFKVVEGFSELTDGFLPFSKKGHIPKADADKIWAEMARRRAEPGYEKAIIARYSRGAQPPAPAPATPPPAKGK